MSKNWKLGDTSNKQNFGCSENLGLSIWNKLKKSVKIDQDYKTLTSTIAYFLNAIAKRDILERKLDIRLFLDPNLKFLFIS